jgi:hypothetical protein
VATVSDTGLDGFVAGLRRCGLEPIVEAGVVAFMVEPLSGSRVGTTVETGVDVGELAIWPAVPPHWVHFPAGVRFAHTNMQPSSKPGWTRHSRQINGWGNAAEPAQAWVAHARAVAGEAIA